MKFVQDSFVYEPQPAGLDGVFKQIEKACRVCYKTENLIKEGSAEKIINNVIIPHGHTSVLEFGTVYLYRFIDNQDGNGELWLKKYEEDRFSRVNCIYGTNGTHVYITTTYRTILQGDYDDPIESIKNQFDMDWKDDLKYLVEPSEYHHKRYCYRFIMDRVGSQSVERHRGRFGISYAQESTRYINYNRDKFESQITCVYPSKFYQLVDEWSKCVDSLTGESFDYVNNLTIEEQLDFLRVHDRGWVAYEQSLEDDERTYMYLTSDECGWKAEDARGVLPLDVKTEFLMCGYPEDWNMWIFRRTDKHAHPHIQKIANEWVEDFKTRINQ